MRAAELGSTLGNSGREVGLPERAISTAGRRDAFGSKQTCQQSFLPVEREALLTKLEIQGEEGASPSDSICPHPLALFSPGWGWAGQVYSMISVPTALQ